MKNHKRKNQMKRKMVKKKKKKRKVINKSLIQVMEVLQTSITGHNLWMKLQYLFNYQTISHLNSLMLKLNQRN